MLKKLLVTNLCLDLPTIAYTLERGCKYEVKLVRKKTQYTEITVIRGS